MAALPLAPALLLGGCSGTSARALPDACYRLADGKPLFRIAGEFGAFPGADPRRFIVKQRGQEIEIYPHFYLHDASGDVRHAQWVPVATQPLRSGRFAVEWHGDTPVIAVPIEASGEVEATPGKAC